MNQAIDYNALDDAKKARTEFARALDLDHLLVVGWSQICGPEFRAAAGDRVVGYHPAPLPRL